MTKNLVFLTAILCLSLSSLRMQAQIPFTTVITENTYGSGTIHLLCVVDSILHALASDDSNFSVDIVSGFLNNISYTQATQTYTNPNVGWYAIYESADGENWDWNDGLTDSIGNMGWIAFVAMDPNTFQADINIPMYCLGIN
jgi:hypothetical protein